MKLTKVQREIIRQKYRGKCAYCGIDLPKIWHVDHLEPVCRNPYGPEKGKMLFESLDTLENLMPSCPPCNQYKHSLGLEGWRKMIEDLPNNLERNNHTYRHALRFGLVRPIKRKVTFHFENATAQTPPNSGTQDHE